MTRSKKLTVLLVVFAVVCVVTFFVSRHQAEKEAIASTDTVILSVDPAAVDSLSWTCGESDFSFHKEDGTWTYDADPDFPVSQEAIENQLQVFQSFAAAFTIEQPEDLGQYGLDEPECTITLTAGGQTYTVTAGDYSAMDSQRYVSLGDGNVYLVQRDPVTTFDVGLADLIAHDRVPALEEVTGLAFTGASEYTVACQPEGAESCREEDVYFTKQGENWMPLDTERVKSYLGALESVTLTDYVTYAATEEEVAACGLTNPDLTVEVTYVPTEEAGGGEAQTFRMSISRDPNETPAEGEEITAYARVGDSSILYRITGDSYESLMNASYDDLRHQEVLPADVSTVSQMEITLEGSTYTLTSRMEGEERVYAYEGADVDAEELTRTLSALEAEGLTSQEPTGKEEIRMTAQLDREGSPAVSLAFYRYDGDSCLAVVDGKPTCLVPRSQVVDFMEAVRAIVLK